MEALKSLAKGIRRGDFKTVRFAFLWHVFQTLVEAYQRESHISFLVMPSGDKESILEWIDNL